MWVLGKGVKLVNLDPIAVTVLEKKMNVGWNMTSCGCISISCGWNIITLEGVDV